MKLFIAVLLSIYLVLFASPSYSEFYKCKNTEGIISFQQTPCTNSESQIDLPAHLSTKKTIVDISKFEVHGIKLGLDKNTVEAIMKFKGLNKSRERKTSVVYEFNNKSLERVAISYTKVNSDSNDYAFKGLSDSVRKVRSYSFIIFTDKYVSNKEYEKHLINRYGDIFFIYYNKKSMTASLSDEKLKKRFNFKLSVNEHGNKIRISGSIIPAKNSYKGK